MNKTIKPYVKHLLAFCVFCIVALAYFSPVLQGKKIFQSDIAQYTAMAKEQNDFRAKYNQEPYWSSSAFGGMPTYQLGANYPHNYIKKIDKAIRFLPRPADYLLLYFLGCYVLLLVLKLEWRLAIIGALAFGFSTYLLIILGVGHNAKAHAIGYFPLVVSGVVLAFRQKYAQGFLLTVFAMALEVNANHFQMTYYLGILVFVLGICYAIDAIKNKTIFAFLKSVSSVLLAVVLAIAINATSLLATKEYANWSTRGTSLLTINPDGSAKTTQGLSKEYITEYSYGIIESFNLIVPRLFGGSNAENLGTDSKAYRFLVQQGYPVSDAKEFASRIPGYWADQPIVAAPAYIGAVVFFFFLLGLFLVKGPFKNALVAASGVSLLLSWGKHFFATDFLITYFPLYDKFRAVSSIQVILELCVPIVGILAIAALLQKQITAQKKQKALLYASALYLVILLGLFLAKSTFSFTGVNDGYYAQAFGDTLMELIRLDRKAMYSQDLWRTFLFFAITALVVFFYQKQKIKPMIFMGAIAFLVVLDLAPIAYRYVNADSFVPKSKVEIPFKPTTADLEILKDTTHFRVYEPALGFSNARTSYFHKALGGYHAAKPAKMQELYDHHIAKNNVGVINMLNVKYIISKDQKQRPVVLENPDANGPAWFVKQVKTVRSANQEIQALATTDLKNSALVQEKHYSQRTFVKDSTASILLTQYAPNQLVYQTKNKNNGFAVFSEMHYPKGWEVTIDGKPATHLKANYALRAMEVPAGTHTIVFSFVPEVVTTASRIALISFLLFIGLLLGYVYKTQKNKTATT